MSEYPKDRYDISDLRQIVALLRSENGCPWDRVQTHQSIRRDFIEETYEAVEAIDKQDPVLLQEELGDVLLQVVFHAQIEEEAGRFSLDDVVSDICEKMVVRHPHVFGELTVDSTGEVLKNWEAIKNRLKGTASYTETLELVPKVYPALIRAQKLTKRAAHAGFCYPDTASARADLQRELEELDEAIAEGDRAHMEEEMGDLLFSCANLCRHLGLDGEFSLTQSCEKFITRFAQVEKLAAKQGKQLDQLDAAQLTALWQQAKCMLK